MNTRRNCFSQIRNGTITATGTAKARKPLIRNAMPAARPATASSSAARPQRLSLRQAKKKATITTVSAAFSGPSVTANVPTP